MNLRKYLRNAVDKKIQGLTAKTQFFLEVIAADEKMRATYEQARQIADNGGKSFGYVTVVVNKGKANEKKIQEDLKNLLTTSGRDFFHAQVYTNTSAGTKGGNGIAVSNEATDPVAGDTTLVGEITTGGLTRVLAATISHTGSTNVTTIENEFTAAAVFSNLHKSALFNQDTIGGQMTHAEKFAADVDLQFSDTLTVTWTCTLG